MTAMIALGSILLILLVLVDTFELKEGEAVERSLRELRGMYEPFVTALSIRFLMPLPPVVPEREPVDNWQTSAWMRRTKGFRQLAAVDTVDDHDD
jgi:hypothetical protein